MEKKKQSVFGFADDRADDSCVCCGKYVPEGRQVCLDCEKKALQRDKSETLLIGFDSSNGEDVSALSVTRWSGGKMVYIKTLLGKEAEDMYDQLTSFGHCVKL